MKIRRIPLFKNIHLRGAKSLLRASFVIKHNRSYFYLIKCLFSEAHSHAPGTNAVCMMEHRALGLLPGRNLSIIIPREAGSEFYFQLLENTEMYMFPHRTL